MPETMQGSTMPCIAHSPVNSLHILNTLNTFITFITFITLKPSLMSPRLNLTAHKNRAICRTYSHLLTDSLHSLNSHYRARTVR